MSCSPQDVIRTQQKAWTEFATPFLGSLRKPRNADVQTTAHAYSAGTALQSIAFLVEKFLSFQRERKAKRFFRYSNVLTVVLIVSTVDGKVNYFPLAVKRKLGYFFVNKQIITNSPKFTIAA